MPDPVVHKMLRKIAEAVTEHNAASRFYKQVLLGRKLAGNPLSEQDALEWRLEIRKLAKAVELEKKKYREFTGRHFDQRKKSRIRK